MGWWIALNTALYIAALATLVTGYWWASFICFLLAIALTLILSSGKADLTDAFDIFD